MVKKINSPKAQPGSSDAGQEVRPSELPVEAGPEPAAGAIPIGLPIPLKNYKALQKKAKRRRKPKGVAQEDPIKKIREEPTSDRI